MNIEALESICKEKNIKFQSNVGRRGLLQIEIPKRRGISTLHINEEAAEKIIESANNFYNYKFVEGYEAIWSNEEKYIECEIQLSNSSISLLRHLFQNIEEDKDRSLSILADKEGMTIEISAASDIFSLLSSLKDSNRIVWRSRNFDRLRQNSATIKVSGIQVERHDEAFNFIENVCSSICFQIDCKTNLPVMLTFERKLNIQKKYSKTLKNGELSYPEYSYDSEALSLYWYARTAYRMPLLKYLALYQVVEFYYPIYSEKAAQDRVRNILKNPKFSIEKEKDIAKILKVTNKSSGLYGNERSQLKATIEACIDIDELKEWLNENEERKVFFNSDKSKQISKFKININAKNEDLINQIIERYYNIRCRIVHTTGMEDDFDVLHPQSKEIQNIHHDIDVADYIAHQVLISSSKPL